ILSKDDRPREDVFSAFPSDISAPEVKIPVTEDSNFAIFGWLQRDAQSGRGIFTAIAGVRVASRKGWCLVRAANTAPVLVLR
ncbi:phosphomannomutase/phosphoglucomutase, partial [Pseudomonas aeruginosa]